MVADAPLLPQRYLCTGREWNEHKRTLSIGLRPLFGDDQAVRLWAWKPGYSRLSAGLIYNIPTRINDDGSMSASLMRASFAERFDDAAQVAAFELSDRAAASAARTDARAKNEARVSDLAKLLRPLREAYEKTNYPTRLAMEVEILAALRRPTFMDKP